MIELESPVDLPEYGTVTCSRCRQKGHNKRTCPEKAEGGRRSDPQPPTGHEPGPLPIEDTHAAADLAATLLARCVVMRADLAELAGRQETHEAWVAVEQAEKCLAYAERVLRGLA